MRQHAVAGLLLAAAAGLASANGRAPETRSINFRQTHEADIWVGLTFGAVVSHDGGATWFWTCEDAIGYAGVWDPDYVYTASGKVFATTYRGPLVNSDGCTFDAEPLASTPLFKSAAMTDPVTGAVTPAKNKFSTAEELGPDGELVIAVDDPTDNHVFKSTDDAASFPTSAAPGILNDWWPSLAIARSDPARIYMTGYRFISGNVEQHLLFRSTNGGTSFVPMSQTGIVFSKDSNFEIAGVSQTEPDVVFLRVTVPLGVIGAAIYRSTDAGDTWTKVLEKQDTLDAFVMRANGDVVAGTRRSGASVAHDCAKAGACTGWTELVNPPHTNCFVENAAGEVWACTQNFGTPTIPGDGYGIMKSTDLVSWSPILKYQDITAPIPCAAGTPQADKCTAQQWCGVKSQLAITADPTLCPVTPTGDGDGDGGITQIKKPKGCCDTGGAGGVAPGAVMLSLVAGITLFRRRRR